jgi:nucleoside-diphosphate-sugar epimerase
VSYSADEIVRTILALSGKKVKVRYLYERRQGEVMDTVADITKAKEKLGWASKFSLEDGLRMVLQSSVVF